MRDFPNPLVEKYRDLRYSDYGQPEGMFTIPSPNGIDLHVMASDGELEISEGWEHVSVSSKKRCPNWPEMCKIKDMFWSEEEVVIQFHPAKSHYVNNHAHCLHMWKPPSDFPVPPDILVGSRKVGVLVGE